MVKDKLLEQLVAVVAELQEICAVLRQNTVLSKNNGLLLKRHTARINGLLLEHGIEKLHDVVEENALLVEQNVILMEERASHFKSLRRLQEKLDELHTVQATKAGATMLVQPLSSPRVGV